MPFISRRTFLHWNMLFAGSTLLPTRVLATKETTPFYLSAYSDALGQHFIALWNPRGETVFTHELPSRGHSFAINPILSQIYCIARRPGKTIDILHAHGTFDYQIVSPHNRHFYGHGLCSLDGRFLYTTENNLDDGTGVIGIRDMHKHGELINEFSSFGIGPHSMHFSHDQRFLIIANGGVHTHPNTGRKKLNLASMSPSLVFIDRETGKLHRRTQLESRYHQNSLRHFAVKANNDVVIALQNQSGRPEQEVLLAYHHYGNNTTQAIPIPKTIAPRLNGYLGDVVFDQSGQSFASTSPRGGFVIFYAIKENTLWAEAFEDSCGVQASTEPNTFIVTNGKGEIRQYQLHLSTQQSAITTLSKNHTIKWDNHITPYNGEVS